MEIEQVRKVRASTPWMREQYESRGVHRRFLQTEYLTTVSQSDLPHSWISIDRRTEWGKSQMHEIYKKYLDQDDITSMEKKHDLNANIEHLGRVFLAVSGAFRVG